MQDILSNWETAAGKFHKVFPHEYRRALEQIAAEKQQEELLAEHDGTDALAALKAAADAVGKDDAREHSYLDYLPPTPEVRMHAYLPTRMLCGRGSVVLCRWPQKYDQIFCIFI